MLVLDDQEKMQMWKERQRTTWGTGMNPTGRYTYIFEGKVRKGIYPKTTKILIKKK
jgi:hypothetical protein